MNDKNRLVESYCMKCGTNFIIEKLCKDNSSVSCPKCNNGTHVVCRGHPFYVGL